ncbi:hypothetical protein G7Y89_g14466 [Cudoniella acicularis]|uniref:NADH:flavin oxidoreductase/NADH oxidase N-terminal domain-containing protein n=1 Tax=Cudoniella acicularis TaxID=354080 RepID=A0A8H4R2X3_9HELO|nr:hypothetical protein G7Y89_g14466 [Cudoniella acicularis]
MNPSIKTQDEWKEWATACQSSGTPTIVQLCHPGRQSPLGAGNRSFFTKNIAPSVVKLKMGPTILAKAVAAPMFGTPREMTEADIDEVIDQFVAGAKQSYDAGFKGVELHGAHGYLLAQFLSPKSNLLNDAFGGSPTKRAEIALRIIQRIRAATNKIFCIGMKFNSVDASDSSSSFETLEQIALVVEAGIDFLEVSGGTMEDMSAMQDPEAPGMKTSTLLRESFFPSFAQAAREKFPKLVLIVTGGFRTRLGMEAALQTSGCDIVGIARPATVIPHLPRDIILNEGVMDEHASVRLTSLPRSRMTEFLVLLIGSKGVGAGREAMYYQGQIQRIARGLKPADTRIKALYWGEAQRKGFNIISKPYGSLKVFRYTAYKGPASSPLTEA